MSESKQPEPNLIPASPEISIYSGEQMLDWADETFAPLKYSLDNIYTGGMVYEDAQGRGRNFAFTTCPPGLRSYASESFYHGRHLSLQFFEGVAIATASMPIAPSWDQKDFNFQLQLSDHTLYNPRQGDYIILSNFDVQSYLRQLRDNIDPKQRARIATLKDGLGILLEEYSEEDRLHGGLFNTAARIIRNSPSSKFVVAQMLNPDTSFEQYIPETKALYTLAHIAETAFEDLAGQYINRAGQNFLPGLMTKDKQRIVSNITGILGMEAMQTGILGEANRGMFIPQQRVGPPTFADIMHQIFRKKITQQIEEWGYSSIQRTPIARNINSLIRSFNQNLPAGQECDWYAPELPDFILTLHNRIKVGNTDLSEEDATKLTAECLRSLISFQNRLTALRVPTTEGYTNVAFHEEEIVNLLTTRALNAYLAFIGAKQLDEDYDLPSFLRNFL